MFKCVMLLVLCSGYCRANAQSNITASITGFENSNGVCRACIFTSASSFKGEEKQYQCKVSKVVNNRTDIVFDNIPPGTYAMSVFHDANNNNKMDKNFFGVPKEGYGASKNKLPFASAPTFKDNQFSVSPNTTIQLSIKIRNL